MWVKWFEPTSVVLGWTSEVNDIVLTTRLPSRPPEMLVLDKKKEGKYFDL